MTMRVLPTALPDVVLLEPIVHTDERGFVLETFSEQVFAAAGLPMHFAQDNRSRSVAGVVRALHYQSANPQGKLVTVITGEIFDVAVDIRVGSPTFGRWAGATLRGESPLCMWIPAGFAHGFAVLSAHADVVYKCTTAYDPDDQRGVRWDDAAIGIPWPVARPLLSAADATHPLLCDAMDSLPRYTP